MNRQHFALPILALIAVIALGPNGCAINRRYATNTIHQLPHSDVRLVYKWTETAIAPAAESAAQAAGERTLSVVYPHPDAVYGRKFADVTLRDGNKDVPDSTSTAIKHLVSNPFREQFEPNEVAASSDPDTMRLLLNQQELEFLLRDLVADGFFEPGDRSAAKDDVVLDVTLGSRSTSKVWDRVPAFHALADRVRSEALTAGKNTPRTKPRSGSRETITTSSESAPAARDASSGTARF